MEISPILLMAEAADDFSGDSLDGLAIFYRYGGSQLTLFVFTSDAIGSLNFTDAWYYSGVGNLSLNASTVLSGNFDGFGADELACLYNYVIGRTKLYIFGR